MPIPRAPIALALIAAAAVAHASKFTPGDLLVSEGNAGPTAPNVSEYTPAGQLVQTINVPSIPGEDAGTGYNRGMVVDNKGRLIVFNGTFQAGISIYDPATSTWTSQLIPGLSIVNNGSYGKIAAYGNYVFMPSQDDVAGAVTPGIFRYNTANGTWSVFAATTSSESIDLKIGADGLLYSLNGDGSPSGLSLQVYDPNSLTLIRNIDLSSEAWSTPGGGIVRDAVPRADGKIWLNQLYSPTFLVDGGGNLLHSYSCPQTSYIDDFEMAPNGDLAQINFDGHVYLLDANFNPIRDFQTTNYYYSQSFGTFVPNLVPEPAALATFALGLGGLLTLRPRR